MAKVGFIAMLRQHRRHRQKGGDHGLSTYLNREGNDVGFCLDVYDSSFIESPQRCTKEAYKGSPSKCGERERLSRGPSAEMVGNITKYAYPALVRRAFGDSRQLPVKKINCARAAAQ